jgi:transposase
MSEPMPSTKSEPEWAAFAAIDWADQKHYWRLVPADSRQQEERGELENTPEAVEVWAASLQQRFDGRPIAVCLEQGRGALIYMLSKYAHLILFPVHPKTAARYRETFCTSGAKDDPNDTASLLDLLLRHRERLRQLQPDTVETRLQLLVEERRRAVNEKTRQSNRLTDCLKLYFPQILRWFDDVGTPLVGDLLERWPSLEELRRTHPGTLRKFFNEHNCRSAERNQERIDAIYAAVSATNDAAVLEAGALTARGLVALIRTLRDTVARLDRRIQQLVATHPEGALFASLPGAGPVLMPRLIVAFGTRRERYDSAYEMQCYSGIAPIKEASGKTSWVHFRRACPMFLRQTFHEFALHSIGQSEWAKAYYDHLRKDEKKTHHAAVRSLTYKWIRIIFRCWKDGKPYDEEVYLNSLRRRGSQLGAALAPATGLGWQTVAGFQRLSKIDA